MIILRRFSTYKERHLAWIGQDLGCSLRVLGVLGTAPPPDLMIRRRGVFLQPDVN